MKEKLKSLKNKRNIIDVLLILIVTIVLSIPLLLKNCNVYYDDGIQHIARAFGTFESIKNGNFNIIQSFTNNFGYSWNLFYGPLTTYGVIAINYILNNFILSYKVFELLFLFISGITMYKLLHNMTSNRNIALLSAIIYISAPYHLTDLYTRNALGEFASFAFIPLVFLGLYNLFNTDDNNYYLAIGAIGLILSHNLSTLIAAIFAIIYIIINIKELKKSKVLKDLIINIVFIVLITSFFTIPLVQTKMMGDYAVYQDGFMANSKTAAENGINFRNLIITLDSDYLCFEIGPCLILLAFFIMGIKRLENNRKEYILFLIFGLLSLFMATKYFPWKYLPEKFSIIQFPWRMLEFSAFFLSIICSINAYIVIKRFNIIDVLVMIIILVLYNRAVVLYPIGEPEKIENLNLGIVSGMQNEIVGGIAKGEYLPVKANNDRFYIATREDKMTVLSGKTIITNEEKDDQKTVFKVNNIEPTEYEAPYIYYPGYLVTVDGIEIDNYESENGFLSFKIDDETEAIVEIKYEGTKLMKLSNIISSIGLITFSIYIFRKQKERNE